MNATDAIARIDALTERLAADIERGKQAEQALVGLRLARAELMPPAAGERTAKSNGNGKAQKAAPVEKRNGKVKPAPRRAEPRKGPKPVRPDYPQPPALAFEKEFKTSAEVFAFAKELKAVGMTRRSPSTTTKWKPGEFDCIDRNHRLFVRFWEA